MAGVTTTTPRSNGTPDKVLFICDISSYDPHVMCFENSYFPAVVTLKDWSLTEEAISKLNNTEFEGHTVSVSIYHSEKILCVAHLPPGLTEEKFQELVAQHGTVDMCFLMRSECTGKLGLP